MDRTTRPRRVALYGRVSIERDERSKSVDDQLAELTEWAQREGWMVVGTYRDDGLSASRYANGRARPGWQRVMDDVTAGKVDALLVWEISRASRDRPVFAALFAACADAAVEIGTGGRLHDLTDADDGFVLDLGAALAVRESALIAKRTRRASRSRAAAGRPNGSLSYGYRRVLDPVTGRAVARELHPDQAPIVKEVARRLLAGEPANAITADLNRRGVTTIKGREWRSGNLTKMVLRPAYAGLRVYRGAVLPDVRVTWPPIISEDDHNRLVELHRDPARDKYRHPTHARHLGTGIFRCGRESCGGPVRVAVDKARPNRYDCRACHRVSRYQAPVDALVEELLWRRLAQPDVVQLLADAAGDDGAMREAAAEVTRLRLKLRSARQAWEDDQLSLEAYTDMEARTLPKIRAAEQRARPRSLPRVVFEVAGPDAERTWKALDIREKRLLVAALVEVTILPAGRGKWKFDPTDIVITWKGA